MEYKVSKNFEMNISFEELIANNKTCKIDLDSTHHFESFNGILIYVTHPEGKEEFSINIGVDSDGFVYEGDYGCQEDFKEILIEDGLKILNHYREMILHRDEMVNLFLNNKLDKDVIEIKLR